MLATLTLDLFTCLRKHAIGPQLTEIERAGLVEIVRSSYFQSYDYSLVRWEATNRPPIPSGAHRKKLPKDEHNDTI
jgi:hypothetical protein